MFVGTSFIPRIGNHTQKIPPITSVNDNKVSSAAGIILDPIEYKIKPKQTRVPWIENNAWFLLDERIALSWIMSKISENIAQNSPAIATVVNFGVSFFHLNETENIENPTADAIPNKKPTIEFYHYFQCHYR